MKKPEADWTSTRRWCYQRISEGNFKRLTNKQVRHFFENGGSLPPDDSGLVRIVHIVVGIKERVPKKVLLVECTIHRTVDGGLLDQDHFMDGITQAQILAFQEQLPDQIVGLSQFAKRRLEAIHRWEMTREDVQELRRVLRGRGIK